MNPIILNFAIIKDTENLELILNKKKLHNTIIWNCGMQRFKRIGISTSDNRFQ